MTVPNRERMRQLRRDRRALGLIEVSVWVPRERADELRQTASYWCSIAIEADPAIMALKMEQDAARRHQEAEDKYDAFMRQVANLRPEIPPERLPKSVAERRTLAVAEARKVYDDTLTKWQTRNDPYAVSIAIHTAADFLVARYHWPYAEADSEAEFFAYSVEEILGPLD
ncbi:MAG TPA: hypothetical protein VK196_06845 [Magnetospirillum sp.]|nr:hypothetical protein [Magnetospirillum sp.]